MQKNEKNQRNIFHTHANAVLTFINALINANVTMSHFAECN